VGRALDNRQRVKNPKKRERYIERKKAVPTRLKAKQRQEQLERLIKITAPDKKD
jgi:hypothetical protein